MSNPGVNIDRIEETLTGGGTSHRVNGIAIKPKFIGPQLPKEKHITGEKSKRRSIDANPQPIPPYNAGNRAEPPPTVAVEPEHSKEFSDGKNKNAVWSFLREDRDNFRAGPDSIQFSSKPLKLVVMKLVTSQQFMLQLLILPLCMKFYSALS